MVQELVLKNARLVLRDEIVEGAICVRDGVIADISERSSSTGEDMEGDYILPGLVELHTDHLENHYSPRPGVSWNKTAAIQAHDAQVAASGITTVFDCLRLGSDEDGGFPRGDMRDMADAIQAAEKADRLRAEHLIHLRCEVPSDDVLEQFEDFKADPHVRLVSLMDHAPGQRQFQTIDQYVLFYKKKRGLTDEEFDHFMKRRIEASDRNSARHRRAIADACIASGVALASHDDATLAHVAESIDHGVKVAEFPTSVEAAKTSHEAGLSVLMGAPNVVRGHSHSGNIAASDLAKMGVLDLLSSDYVPFSLLYAPFLLADQIETITLPQAIAMVSANPAKVTRLDDRGAVEVGLNADLVRVRRREDVPVVRSVWRRGNRVS